MAVSFIKTLFWCLLLKICLLEAAPIKQGEEYLEIVGNKDPQEPKLHYVQIFFTGGDRMPYPEEVYPKHPHQLAVEDKDLRKDLSESSREQMRRLGQWIQERYGDLISEGVYAFRKNTTESEKSMHQVLEELGLEKEVDVDVAPEPKNCKKFGHEIARVYDFPDIQETLAQYHGLFRFLSDKTGWNFDERPDDYARRLRRYLDFLALADIPRPAWVTRGMLDLLDDITALHFDIENYTPTLRRLRNGMLLDFFLAPTVTGMYLQAADESLVSGLMRLVSSWNPDMTRPASAVALEKWSDGDDMYVKVFLRIQDYDFPIPFSGCPNECSINDFKRMIIDALPTLQDINCLRNGV